MQGWERAIKHPISPKTPIPQHKPIERKKRKGKQQETKSERAATFTPSIQSNLGLPRTRPPLTLAINTLLSIRQSSILSTCQNHLNTLRSALLANSLSIPALLRTSSFLTLLLSYLYCYLVRLEKICNSCTSVLPNQCFLLQMLYLTLSDLLLFSIL